MAAGEQWETEVERRLKTESRGSYGIVRGSEGQMAKLKQDFR